MKQHIVSLPHHPKRVIVISLVVAALVGYFGITKINEERANSPFIKNTNTNSESLSDNHNLTLGFLASGRIKSVSVKAGDTVTKGQVLATLEADSAQGALIQAKAAYQNAQANYKKIINGATGPAIDVAKAAVHTAQVNFDGVTKQQNLLVSNARINLLNSSLEAQSKEDNSIAPPSITGTYNKDTEGTIVMSVYQTGSGAYVSLSGMVTGTVMASTTLPQPIGDTGLFIKFSSVSPYAGTTWTIDIPNKTGSNYLTNYNAYQSAQETRTQTIANAQAVLDQANASLAALVATARPEDVAVAQAQMQNAQGAVDIAQANLSNTIITSPSLGKILSVTIIPGQIAIPNAPAIEFMSTVTSN